MATHHSMNGHPPSPGYSPIIQWIVTHHPQDGNPISQGWSPALPRLVTHLWGIVMVNHHPLNFHLSSLGLSPIIQNMVIQLPKDVNPASKGWSPMIPCIVCIVTNHPKLMKLYKVLGNSN